MVDTPSSSPTSAVTADDYETTTCAVCGSAAAQPYCQLTDYYLDRPEVATTLVHCSQCGLVYQNPRPTLAVMGQHYPAAYAPYQAGTGKRPGKWLQAAYDYGMRKRTRFVTQRKTGGTLLDIGCATGLFLQGMRGQGNWQVYGVEINPDVAAAARALHGLEVFAGTLEEARYPDKMFDVVTMWDVLEHLHDPAATLREIHRILKDDGMILVRVPNLASWDAKPFGRYWAGLDSPRHLYVFSPTTLAQLLCQNGFGVVGHSSGIGSYMVWVLSVEFWLNGWGAPPTLKRWVKRLLYHPLTRIATAPLFYLPSQLVRGPLVVTVADKDPHAAWAVARAASSTGMGQEDD